uniref:Uncharacterized protein n=1 Tax=Rhipicephalus appendiculatus TaxID=34631 RepID=A0A131YFB4_RHIAP
MSQNLLLVYTSYQPTTVICCATKNLQYDHPTKPTCTGHCMKRECLRKWQLHTMLVNSPCRTRLQDLVELFEAASAFCFVFFSATTRGGLRLL